MYSSLRFACAFKGLISPPSEPPGEVMSFGVSPVNYSDSDSWSETLEIKFWSENKNANPVLKEPMAVLGVLCPVFKRPE